MQIGLINQLHGRPDGDTVPPSWNSTRRRAAAAEEAGFDIFVFEDALLYRGDQATDGVWESVAIAGALAAITSRIHLGQSVVNSPYRSPAMTAKIAETLDEISGGRYVLGIGAGNTPDSDYEAFGFPVDRRYARFSEAIQIIHELLKTGATDFDGEFYSAKRAEMVLRGPRPDGPPINIAAGGPKMLQLVARYGDAWNWWGYDETVDETAQRLKPIIDQLNEACETEGRDPSTLRRTFDVYTVVPGAFAEREGRPGQQPITGHAAQIAERILSLGALGFEEVRCDVWPKEPGAILEMADVVRLVHAS